MFTQSDSDMLSDVRSLNERRESDGLGRSFNHACALEDRLGSYPRGITAMERQALLISPRPCYLVVKCSEGLASCCFWQEWLARGREQ